MNVTTPLLSTERVSVKGLPGVVSPCSAMLRKLVIWAARRSGTSQTRNMSSGQTSPGAAVRADDEGVLEQDGAALVSSRGGERRGGPGGQTDLDQWQRVSGDLLHW